MILALVGTLAIVIQDHATLRAAPRATATVLARTWQGDVLEIRAEHAGYFKVYDYRRERGGYLREDAARPLEISEAAAPELLAVLRFLRDDPGLEALGIGYGAAYLKAANPKTLTAEPFDAIAQMAERLADRASGGAADLSGIAPRLDVVEQYGVHMREIERSGRIRVCYDGELYRRVLAFSGATPEARAHASLGITRPDCIDPNLGPVPRAALDVERSEVLEGIPDEGLEPMTRSRLHARRAGVWASVAFDRDRHGESAQAAAERANAELLDVNPGDFGDDGRVEYADAVIRVSAIRWAGAAPAPQPGPLALSAVPGDSGQTCLSLRDSRWPGAAPLVRRCTYGMIRMGSIRWLAQGSAVVLAVQPLESWRELWVFHRIAQRWSVDVLSPGLDDPDKGYVDFAGFVPGTRRLLIAREVEERARIRRSFEELRLDDLAVVRQAGSPQPIADFGRWQDAAWREGSLALH